MRGTVADLQEAIQHKRLEISLSRDNIQSVQEDLKSKKRSLHELQLELATLERALSILKGQHQFLSPPTDPTLLALQVPRRAGGRHRPSGAVFVVAENILRVQGRPMTVGEMLPLLLAERDRLGLAHVSKEGMTGVLYRFAKRDHIFSYLGPGKFGLREWDALEKSEGGERVKGNVRQTA